MGRAAGWRLYLSGGRLVGGGAHTTWPLWLFFVALGLALLAGVQYVVGARREVRA